MKTKFKIGITLFVLGLLGILTMLSVDIPLDNLPKSVTEKFSPSQLQFLILINPTILLLLSVVVGTILYDKVELTIPTISSILKIGQPQTSISGQLKNGIALGIIAGIFIIIVAAGFQSFLPQEFVELNNKIKLTTIARLGYGGITEEILLRFGLMTLIIWVISKIMGKLKSSTYWIGIVIASVLFAVGHFPVLFAAVSNPNPILFVYIVIGNSIGGMIFGWLYWKKGLEAAFVGHMFTHLTMIVAEAFLKL